MKQAYFYLPCGNKLDSESPNFRGYYDVKQSMEWLEVSKI